MKKLYFKIEIKLFLLLLLLIIISNNIYSQNYFYNRLNVTGQFVLTRESSSGIYTSFITGTSPNSFAVILKQDSQGNVIWAKEYNRIGGTSIRDFNVTPDDGLIITGIKSVTASSNEMVLLKIDVNGNIQWSKKYFVGSLTSIYPNSVLTTPDSGYAVIGGESLGSTNNRTMLMKFDFNGNFLFAKNYSQSSTNGDIYSKGQVTSDGGFIISSDIPLLIKTDANGDTLWTYGPGNGSKVIETSNGDFIAGESYIPSASNNLNVQLTYITSTGNKMWEMSFGTSLVDQLLNLSPSTDGGCFITGETDNLNDVKDFAYVAKINSSGQIVWSTFATADSTVANQESMGYCIKQFANNSVLFNFLVFTSNTMQTGLYQVCMPDMQPVSGCALSNAGFTAVPFTPYPYFGTVSVFQFFTNESNDSIWTNTVSAAANSVCLALNTNNILSDNPVTIFPNPGNGYFYVNSLSSEEMKIKIYSALGNCVYQSKFKNHSEIDLRKLSSGIYFYESSNSRGLKTINKLIISN